MCIQSWILNGLGSLPPGTPIQKNSDGSISVGGKKLPPGASLQTNSDGTVSITGIVPDKIEDMNCWKGKLTCKNF